MSSLLAWSAPAKADMYELISERLWYKFEERNEEWEAWTAANPNSSYVDNYSSRAVTVLVSTSFISAWSAAPAKFVKKYSGGCLRDYSSGAGGWCLLETNDTDLFSDSQTVYDVYGSFSDFSNVIGEDDDRGMLFYRLSSSDFDGLETAWTDVPIQDYN